MTIHARGQGGDILTGANSPFAARTELHRHVLSPDGVMRMEHVAAGFPVTAGSTLALKRSGKHVMLLGIKRMEEYPGRIPLTLSFAKAGRVELQVPLTVGFPGVHGCDH